MTFRFSSNDVMESGYLPAPYALIPASFSSFHFASSSFRSSAVSFLGGSAARQQRQRQANTSQATGEHHEPVHGRISLSARAGETHRGLETGRATQRLLQLFLPALERIVRLFAAEGPRPATLGSVVTTA